MRRTACRLVTTLVTTSALLASGVTAASATTWHDVLYQYNAENDRVHNSMMAAQTPPEPVGGAVNTMSGILGIISNSVSLFKSCESSPSPFPACLTDGGPSLSDIQKQIAQLSSQIAAFQKECEQDFA